MSPLENVVHAVASQPLVYDLIQRVAGSEAVNRELNRHLDGLPTRGWLVDVGGGTGLSADLDLSTSRYVCTDIDPAKLGGFRRKHASGLAVRADARHLPFRDGSIDVVMCKAVSHHLDDGSLQLALAEAARILKPAGRLVFLDAIAAPTRWQSRLLWRYDRGSHPRSEADLRNGFESSFTIDSWTRFAVHHLYVLAIGRPRQR